MANRTSLIMILSFCIFSGLLGTYFIEKTEVYSELKLKDYSAVHLSKFTFRDYFHGREAGYFKSTAFGWRILKFQSLTLLMLLLSKYRYVKYVTLTLSCLLLWLSYSETQVERGDIHLCEFCNLSEDLHVSLGIIIFILTGITLIARDGWREMRK